MSKGCAKFTEPQNMSRKTRSQLNVTPRHVCMIRVYIFGAPGVLNIEYIGFAVIHGFIKMKVTNRVLARGVCEQRSDMTHVEGRSDLGVCQIASPGGAGEAIWNT